MFRFNTYEKLGIQNLKIVGKNATEHTLTSASESELRHYFSESGALGFYFTFSDKYHPVAHAFFPKLSKISSFWSKFCPVNILLELCRNRLLTTVIFPKARIRTEVLSNYMRFLTNNSQCLGGRKFTPHSLRIGGHTFFSMKNLDEDFVHFLGRRAISKACQRYYRANSYDNIKRLELFFESISHQHILQR